MITYDKHNYVFNAANGIAALFETNEFDITLVCGRYRNVIGLF